MITDKPPNHSTTQTAIIGAGPAGIAAAIQLQRYGFAPIILEKDNVGGLLRNANLVENYPGFPNGIPGPKLVALFEKHLRQVGAEIRRDEVLRLDYDGGNFLAKTQRNTYQATNVIIATGTKPKQFPIEIPAQAKNRVFSEVWPLLKTRGKHVTIVGAGDAAFDYALNLASRGNTVTILNRSTEVSCLPLLWERARATPAISYRDQITLQRIESDTATGRLQLFADDPSTKLRAGCSLITNHCLLITDYLLFAIGRETQMDFLTEGVKLQAQRLVEDGKLYLVGDVHNDLYRQTAIAVGEGLRAAMQIYANMEKVR